MKSGFGYILVFLGIAVGICLIMLTYLILVPSASLFGFKYININATEGYFQTIDESSLGTNTLKNVIINSHDYELQIMYNEDDVDIDNKQIEFMTLSHIAGFYNNNVATPYVSFTLPDNDTIEITINEPLGLILSNSSIVKVALPKCINYSSLKVNTVNSYISLGKNDETKLEVNNLEINATGRSNLEINNFNCLNKMTFKCNEGNYKVNENISGSCEIDSTYGNFYLENIGGALTILGKNPIVNAYNVTGTTTISSEQSTTTFKVLNTLLVDSEYASITVSNSISGGFIINATNSILNFSNVLSNVVTSEIISEKGNVTIKDLKCNLNMNCTRTKVTITLADANIDIKNSNAEVSISYKNTSASKTVKVENNRGVINLDNIKGIVEVKNSYAATNIKYLSVNGKSTIKSNSSVNLNCPLAKYSIAVNSDNVNVNLGSLDADSISKTEIDNGVSYNFYKVNDDASNSSEYTDNVIMISSQGTISITN